MKINLRSNLENVRIQYIILSMIVLTAAVLRIYRLGMWSFWVEEFHTVRHTAEIDSIEGILGNFRAIYYILNKPVFLLLGETEWTARALPVVFGILAIPLTYWITKRLFGFTSAILAAFLLAISPWHLYWSQNARFYTFFLLLFNISFITYYWGIEKNRFAYIAVSILTLILATMTHLLAGLLIPLFIIYFIILKIGPFEKPPGLTILNLLPFIILPILGYFAIEIFRIFIINTNPLFENIYENFISDSRIFPGYEDPVVMLKSAVYYIGTPITLSSLFGSVFLLYQRNRAGLFIACGAFLPLFVLMVLSPFVTVVNRYVFMTLPFWIILAALGIHELYRSRSRLLWILYLLSLLFLLFRDPVSEDLVHYLKLGQYLPLYIIVISILFSIVVLWQLLRINSDVGHRWNLILISIILFILFIHPMVTNTLYFQYQHGHRDNLKAATTLIAMDKNEGDRVVAAIPLLVEYYLEEEIEYVQDFDANVEPQNNQRIWLIQDSGVEKIKENSFGYWINYNCKMEGKWDNFTGGRNWKMRVYLCES